jgi:transposase
MVIIEATSANEMAGCPDCQQLSRRVHSRYQRHVTDLPLAGWQVKMELQVRRYFCDNQRCTRRTFAERLPDFVVPFARRSIRLAEQQRQTALTTGGEAGARLLSRLAMPTSGATLLRLIRAIVLPLVSTPRVMGVDDWAWAKGQRYGTILVDLERHQPIDLLPDRSIETVVAWLQAHPGIEIISRDRGQTYIDAIKQGASAATAVADRWHLMKNWRETMEHLLNRHPACLTAATSPEPEVTLPLPATSTEPGISKPPLPIKAEQRRQANHQRRLDRYQQVLELHQQGLSQQNIGQRVGLSSKTIRCYLKLGHLPEITRQRRPGLLKPFLDYLHARWQVGCHNGAQLYREIKQLGYTGRRTTVADWVAVQRKQLSPQQRTTAQRKRPWSARAVSWLLVKAPEKLKPDEKATVERVLQASDLVSRAYHFGQAFLRLVRQRYNKALGSWLTAALESDITDLRQFAKSLVQDQAAVQAALSLPWSNGQTEGQVNRLKLIKRQMYGRAKFDLLKLRFMAT